MALGAALLFNIKLPTNFLSPYKATSIQDFWRRWHITLSHFLRDYIYIPLGGNQKGTLRTSINLFVTFLLGGLWHGASWMFVFWGALHGGALVIHRLWKQLGFSLNKYIAWFLTFNFINISWIFFRAKNWDDALKVLHGMFFGSLELPYKYIHRFHLESFHITANNAWLSNLYADKYLLLYLLLAAILLTFKNSMELKQLFVTNKRTLLFSVLLALIALLNLRGVHEFLYFNF